MNCHILDLAMLKEYGERKIDYINRIKNYFNDNIKNAIFKYNGQVARVLYYSDKDPDKSWRKFSIGLEENHNNTTKIDHNRLPYLHLISKVLNNDFDCYSCSKYKVEQLKNNRSRLILKCDSINFIIILQYCGPKKGYLILSAYIKRSRKS